MVCTALGEKMLVLAELHALLEVTSLEIWAASLFALVQRVGFDMVLIGLVKSQAAPLEGALLSSNYPEEWRSIYVKHKMHSIDPVVAHCFKSAVPIQWASGKHHSKVQREFYGQASEFGLRCGVTYPIHGVGGEFGMISFASTNQSHEAFQGDVKSLTELSLLRDYAHESVNRFTNGHTKAQHVPPLTPRELQCLQWVAAGKTSWEISSILNCSEATVNFHIANLMRKFHVYTRQQAVVRAIHDRLIVPL